MPESVTISWDEYEALLQQVEEYGEVVRCASNWEIEFERHAADRSPENARVVAIAEGSLLRAVGQLRRDRKAKIPSSEGGTGDA